ncbi:haloacid dehalogenase-like hydrolase, putative [Phytophthora infestans T30-4]|uniref:Haloacid dehalogenase-like hydrolase, putative n=1 Tax=Phytophthora infestans (strain T30-4) TaxID=403677 RepID=D0P1N2_PHYIT|nr:haloacid dehalogenase-like hydrolase, putative [Phytophthora infestans T30-4]EEY54664.1 haloacid dehalogenase-like hydrolase, putative [Phytophthora infestans T30-4]|eukprot:XP_002895805.1 haloacid dehalogenase-like hydrolase, putative [Phytophthora infestans T30-4]
MVAEPAAVAVRGVTFDLDDTLWCGKTVIRKASAAFHSYLAQATPQLADRFPPAAFDELLVQFQRALPDHAHDYTFLRKYTLRHCVEVCGAHELNLHDQVALEAFVDAAFLSFLLPRSQPEPRSNGMIDVASRILGVITQWKTGEMDILLKYFQHHMHFMISAELVGSAKPGQAIFDAAVAKFPASYSRQHLVHVGDHYKCDVEGAKRAGLRTIWVNASWAKPDALTRTDLSNEDAERYAAADAIVKEVNSVLLVVERWNSLAARPERNV